MKNNLSLTFTHFHHSALNNKKNFYTLHFDHFNRGVENLNIFKLSMYFTFSYINRMKKAKIEKFEKPPYVGTDQAIEIYRHCDKTNSMNISHMNKGRYSNLYKISQEIEFFEIINSGRRLYIPKDLLVNAKSVSEIFVVSFLLNYKPLDKEWTFTSLKQHITHLVDSGKLSGAFRDWSLKKYLKKYRAVSEGLKAEEIKATEPETDEAEENLEPSDEELVEKAEAEADEWCCQPSDEGLIAQAQAQSQSEAERCPVFLQTDEELIQMELARA